MDWECVRCGREQEDSTVCLYCGAKMRSVCPTPEGGFEISVKAIGNGLKTPHVGVAKTKVDFFCLVMATRAMGGTGMQLYDRVNGGVCGDYSATPSLNVIWDTVRADLTKKL